MASVEERTIEKPSWIQRLGSSFRGVLTGFVFFIAGIVLLFWNEGRAVDTAKRLKAGAAAVVEVSADQVDPANEGKLVYVNGKANTQDVLVDEEFGVSVNALYLQRTVEVYQWVEYSKTERVGENKERTTYDHKLEWHHKHVDSSEFHNAPPEAVNPSAPPRFENREFIAGNVSLGAFKLSEEHVKRVNAWKEFSFPTNYVVPASMKHEKGARYVYVPVDSNALESKMAQFAGLGRSVAMQPKPGDLRVSFKVVLPCDVSIIQGQKGDALVPWTTPKGDVLPLLINTGTVPAKAMFAKALSANSTLTWFLRIAGLIVMYIGLKGILGPIDTLVDAIPILNGIVAMGTSLAACLVAGACGLLTIGISWIYHRPWVGIPLVLGGVGLFVMLFLKKKKSAAATV